MFSKIHSILVPLFCATLSLLSGSLSCAALDEAASHLNSQGIASYRAGKLDEAVKLYREALKELDANNGSNEMRATVLNNLSIVLSKQGNEEEAKAAEEKANNLRGNPTGSSSSTSTILDTTRSAGSTIDLPATRPVFAGSKTDFGTYVSNFQAAVRRNWWLPAMVVGKVYRAVLVVHIAPSGRVTEFHLSKGSGSDVFDKSVLDALSATSKFEPIPEASTHPNGLDVQMTFEEKVTSKQSLQNQQGTNSPPKGGPAAPGTAVAAANPVKNISKPLIDKPQLLGPDKQQRDVNNLKRLVEKEPNNAESHLDYATALARIGRTDEGIEEVKSALALEPGNEEARLTLGSLYQSNGQLEKSIAVYRDFLRRFPRSKYAKRVKEHAEALESENDRMHPGQGTIPGVPGISSSDSGDDYYDAMVRGGIRRWPSSKMPLKVHITSGSDVPGYRSEFTRILTDCFEDWSTASIGKIRFSFVSSAEDCDIDCYWTDDLKTLASPAEEAEAQIYSHGKEILSCKIVMYTGTSAGTKQMTSTRARLIYLHEIGHALGLNRHTSNPADVMFFTSSFKDERKDLSPRDRNTINRLYSNSTEE